MESHGVLDRSVQHGVVALSVEPAEVAKEELATFGYDPDPVAWALGHPSPRGVRQDRQSVQPAGVLRVAGHDDAGRETTERQGHVVDMLPPQPGSAGHAGQRQGQDPVTLQRPAGALFAPDHPAHPVHHAAAPYARVQEPFRRDDCRRVGTAPRRVGRQIPVPVRLALQPLRAPSLSRAALSCSGRRSWVIFRRRGSYTSIETAATRPCR